VTVVRPAELRILPDLPEAAGVGTRVEGPELLPLAAGEQYRFTFAMDACIGCHSCEVACAEQNGLPAEVAWRRVGEFEGGDHPHARRFHLVFVPFHFDEACANRLTLNEFDPISREPNYKQCAVRIDPDRR
jgi:hypothetical protein